MGFKLRKAIAIKNEDGIEIADKKIEIAPTDTSTNLGDVPMERMLVKDLVPADYNPRFMTDKARNGLSKSIDRYGLLQPIIHNKKTGNIVGGHQRLYDLLAKGVEYTDVVVVNLSEEKEKEANIVLNNKHISGEYTYDLQNLLDDIDLDVMEDLNLDELTDKETFDADVDDEDSIIASEKGGAEKSEDVDENIVTVEFLPEDYELFLTLIAKFNVGYKARSQQFKIGLKLGQLLKEYDVMLSNDQHKPSDGGKHDR